MQGLKNSPESAKYLAMAMEMYFTLIDDQDADVRMVADENLNRVTRSLGDSSVGRLQVTYISSRQFSAFATYVKNLIGYRLSCTRRSRRMAAVGE